MNWVADLSCLAATTLIAALSAAGVHTVDAIGSVILYRIITFKLLTSALWVAYAHLRARREWVQAEVQGLPLEARGT